MSRSEGRKIAQSPATSIKHAQLALLDLTGLRQQADPATLVQVAEDQRASSMYIQKRDQGPPHFLRCMLLESAVVLLKQNELPTTWEELRPSL
mmetsp:Transcript_43137/g.101336  ORF Transcript_43137/g.101336 Transcript_43137/m.101336 type:complete len:93 (+) Transcript_43137:84-362(+)